MSNLRIPSWDTQDANGAFAFKVQNINNFTLTAAFPAIADWENAKLRSLLHDRLHDDISKLLRSAEFFSEERLEQKTGADYFTVQYEDDVYDFAISCYHNRLVLEKRGVLLRTFHHWYHAAVPGVKTVFDSLLSLMSTELKRNQAITSVSYKFRFVTYDFSSSGKPKKNFQVLNRLITLVPGPTGDIASMSDEPKDISRLDYHANCWDSDGNGQRRRLSYSAQAPANRNYSGLWFDFAYGSETYADPETGAREASDPGLLLDEYERVYAFMWHRAVGGFMKSLLNKIDFETTASYIP
jgi:hypothetical protein